MSGALCWRCSGNTEPDLNQVLWSLARPFGGSAWPTTCAGPGRADRRWLPLGVSRADRRPNGGPRRRLRRRRRARRATSLHGPALRQLRRLSLSSRRQAYSHSLVRHSAGTDPPRTWRRLAAERASTACQSCGPPGSS